MPIAAARSGLSRIARSDMPNGEWTIRRATRNSTNRTARLYANAVRPERSNANSPSSGFIAMPCSPSAPPVIDAAGWRSRPAASATPSVTIRRVRSVPRSTRKLVAKPSSVATRGADGEAQQRIAARVLREQAGGIRAEPEERGVTERHDAGVAEDEIERQREQRHDRDLVADQRLAGQREERGQREQPERDLAATHAMRARERRRDARRGVGSVVHDRGPGISAPARTGPAVARAGSRSSACR